MKVHRVLATMAVLSMGMRMVVACGSPLGLPLIHDDAGTPTGSTCQTDGDCYSSGYNSGFCVTNTCDLGKCVVHNLALGSIPLNPEITAGVCQRVVCDGKGNETVEPDPQPLPQNDYTYCQKMVCDDAGNALTVPDPSNPMPGPALSCFKNSCDDAGNTTMAPDPSNVPSQPAPACQKNACSDAGNVVNIPDPSNVPSETAPACQKIGCDDAGNITTPPDPSNLPAATPGTCTTGACDDAGNASTVPDPTNVPPPTTCDSYTCNGSTPVAVPQNAGTVCSMLGMACDTAGNCDVCPATNAQCTDPGPGATAHSIGTAYSFGTIGFCDDDGSILCGALTGSEESWFSYVSSGTFSLCTFGPSVAVQAMGPVKLCEYFQSTTLTCPSGSTAATDTDGDMGCCITTLNGSMSITPDSDDTEALIQVENTTGTCVGYMMSFHS